MILEDDIAEDHMAIIYYTLTAEFGPEELGAII